MTLRHVLTVFVALAGIGVIGAVITSACRRLWDWREQRAYVPPSVLYTEVWPAPIQVSAPNLELPPVEFKIDATAWALDALSDVRKAASEDDYATLGEFTRPVPSSPALIGCEVEALFELRRLAVTA